MDNIRVSGIKCDNPKCDYKDESVTYEQYPEYINKPCPTCGENLLTQEDYDFCAMSDGMLTDLLNNISDEDFAKMTNGMLDVSLEKAFAEEGITEMDLKEIGKNISFEDMKGVFDMLGIFPDKKEPTDEGSVMETPKPKKTRRSK